MNKPFKMGRLRPRVSTRYGLPRLRDYLTLDLPPAPPAIDYTKASLPFLHEILGNDALGDCTCAGVVHVLGAWIANAGGQVPFTAEDAVGLYEGACGYKPGDPQSDQGGDEQTVLDYVKTTGVKGHKLTSWARVDATNAEQVRTAVYLFENVYFGVELPQEWVSPMPSGDGFEWDVAGAPDPDNGHCFVGLGYTDKGVIVDSWGLLGTITWAAIARYASTVGQGELYTLLGPDSIALATQKAPNGFSAAQLAGDIAILPS